MRQKSKVSFRAVFLLLICAAGFGAVFSSLAGLYIPEPLISEEAESIVNTRTVPASRGGIYDRYGKPLVGNEVKYTLEFDYSGIERKRMNRLIYDVLALLDERGIDYTDTMPIGGVPFSYTCPSGGRDEKRMADFLRYRGLDAGLSAQDAMIALCDSYGIPASFSPSDARRVIGVLYEMHLADFSALTPFMMTKGLDEETVSIISVQREKFRGVRICTDYERILNTPYCAHILGRTGAIPKDRLEYYTDKGYPINAVVGIDGAERAFEDMLRASPGIITARTDEDGNILDVISKKDAVSGGNVYLTIDLDLQAAAEDALERHIRSLRDENGEAAGGAAVALDPNTGEILALASYPTFSLSDFSADYNKLLEDPLKPMFDRAIAGTYAPGSTFKMITATAALKAGVITPDDKIACDGVYTYYAPDYLYHCWLYNETGKTHGLLRLSEALAGSCNCFFYEVGRSCGIDRIAQCAQLFGLGQKTGIELAGEASGCIASPQLRKDRGTGFYPGDTLQAAIGQSDTLVTPLQLASYISTLVNGGKRYAPHLLYRVETQSTGRAVYIKESELTETVGYKKTDLDAILGGMLAVTSDGTAKSVFEDYPIAVLGKSGSAQTGSGDANAIFVLAAPAEKPEIVIAVVIEHGKTGNNAALAARDILDAYESKRSAIQH